LFNPLSRETDAVVDRSLPTKNTVLPDGGLADLTEGGASNHPTLDRSVKESLSQRNGLKGGEMDSKIEFWQELFVHHFST
jgi:hypothetical protein